MVRRCAEIKILRRVRAESSRRPPRHRRDACSMAWLCRFLSAPDTLVDFHPGSANGMGESPSGAPDPSTWPRPGSRRCASIRRRTATTRCRSTRCCGATATFYMIYRRRRSVGGARGGRAATPAPTYCGTTTARSARSTSRRGRRRAATTRRPTNWSCGTSTTSQSRRGNFSHHQSSRPRGKPSPYRSLLVSL
jgi:hypothetical protein